MNLFSIILLTINFKKDDIICKEIRYNGMGNY
jgi:hypothetical protein